MSTPSVPAPLPSPTRRWIEGWGERMVRIVFDAAITAVIAAVAGFLADRLLARYVMYDFEDSSALGWNVVPDAQAACKDRGCAFLARRLSDLHTVSGNGSLEVDVDLRGGSELSDKPQHAGEISVYVEQAPPAGLSSGLPANLFLASFEATVYVPPELVSRQATTTAGFLQLFAHGCAREEPRYDGEPGQLVRAAGPVRLRYRFWSLDTRQICRVGIKMGLNTADRGSYQGRIYIDDVRWTTTAWYWRVFFATVLLVVGGLVIYRRRSWRRHAIREAPPGARLPS